MRLKLLVINDLDNVATAVLSLQKGETADVKIGGSVENVQLLDDIPFGHKAALRDIGRGEKIVKYGEIVGQSTAGIRKGEHVHIHNVEGLRGRGDK